MWLCACLAPPDNMTAWPPGYCCRYIVPTRSSGPWRDGSMREAMWVNKLSTCHSSIGLWNCSYKLGSTGIVLSQETSLGPYQPHSCWQLRAGVHAVQFSELDDDWHHTTVLEVGLVSGGRWFLLSHMRTAGSHIISMWGGDQEGARK